MGVTEELRRMQRRQLLSRQTTTQRLIRQIYMRAAARLSQRAAGAKDGSLTKRWAEDYGRAVEREIERITAELESAITSGADAAARIRADGAQKYLQNVFELAGWDVSDSFTGVLSQCRTDALQALVGGKMYSDGRMLSRRIWNITGRLQGGIEEIIAQGIAQQQSTYQIARALEACVNPKAAQPADWRNLYPDTPFSMNVDYNAIRLARTAINHVYWQTGINSARENPFCEAMHWELSNSHYERQVAVCGRDECDEYAAHDEGLGRGNFPIDKLPRPHPNCLCIQYEVLPEPEQAAARLREWMRGGSDPGLEKGFARWAKREGTTVQTIRIDKGVESGTIEESTDIPHSLGAKSLNYEVDLPDGSRTTFTEGTRITNIKVIAGKGRDRQIDEIDNLLMRFGGDPLEWQKKKGIGFVDMDGESYEAEVHWYEEPSVGRVKFKVKWLIDE